MIQMGLFSQRCMEGTHLKQQWCMFGLMLFFLFFSVVSFFMLPWGSRHALQYNLICYSTSKLKSHRSNEGNWEVSINILLINDVTHPWSSFRSSLPLPTTDPRCCLLSSFFAPKRMHFQHWEMILWNSVFLRMTLLAFWPQYVKDLKCLQPSQNDFNKYVNQSMFIYSLAELKDLDFSQNLCVIYYFKWLNNSESKPPGDEHAQKDIFFMKKPKTTKLPIISFCAPARKRQKPPCFLYFFLACL